MFTRFRCKGHAKQDERPGEIPGRSDLQAGGVVNPVRPAGAGALSCPANRTGSTGGFSLA